MPDIYHNAASPFAPLAETVSVAFRDAAGNDRVTTLRAVVVAGAGLSDSAGAPGHAETADRFTVSFDVLDWPYDAPPSANYLITTSGFGALVVKHVQVSSIDYTLRCTRGEKRRAP